MTVGALDQLLRLGRQDEALGTAEEWLTGHRADSWVGLYNVHTVRLQILAIRGEVEVGRDSLEWLESRIDSAGDGPAVPVGVARRLGVRSLESG